MNNQQNTESNNDNANNPIHINEYQQPQKENNTEKDTNAKLEQNKHTHKKTTDKINTGNQNNENDNNNTINNDKHTTQTKNVTTRKKKQNNNTNKEYTIHKEPPQLNDDNFLVIENTSKSKTKSNQNIQNNPNNITVIPETPLDQQNQCEENIRFLSPSLITTTNITKATPTPINTSPPTRNDIDELHQLTIQPKPEHLTEAKKTATQLRKKLHIGSRKVLQTRTI